MKYAVAAVLLIGALLFIKPRSEATIVRSWRMIVAVDEALLPLGALEFTRSLFKLFIESTTTISSGPINNRYYCDGLGYVRELRLRSAGIRSIRDLNGINSLSRLRKLDLMGNPLEGDLDVSNFTELEELSLSRAHSPRIVGLEKLTSLRRVTIRYSGMGSVSRLFAGVRLPRLEHLDLSGNPLEPTVDLAPFPGLQELILAETGVRAVPNLYGVRIADLHGSPIQKIGGVATLTTLDIADTQLPPDVSFFEAPALSILRLDGATLTNLSGYQYSYSLRTLSLKRAKNVDLNRLQYLTKLTVLLLDESDAKDVTPLKALPMLSALSLRNTNIRDLRSLKDSRNLIAVRVASGQFDERDLRAQLPASTLIIYDHARTIPQLLSRGERIGFSGVLIVLVIMPFVLRASLARRVVRTVLPFQLASFWRAWGIFDVATYVLWRIVPGEFGRWAGIMFKAASTYVLLYTLVLFLSRWQRFGASTLSLWIQRLRYVAAPALILLPCAWLSYSAELGVISDIGTVFFSGLAVAGGLLEVYLAFKPVGNLRELSRDIFRNHGRLIRFALPQPHGPRVFSLFGSRNMMSDFPRAPEAFPNYIQVTAVHSAIAKRRWIATGCDPGFCDAILIDLSSGDLVRAASWELSLVEQWIREAWGRTCAPIWLTGDWVEHGGLDSIPSVRAQQWVEGILPFLSGLTSGEEVADKASGLNRLTPPTSLAESGLFLVLRETYTPVARLVRQVFACGEVPERIDLLVTACETALAFFALVVTAEYQSAISPKLPKSARRLLNEPTFSQWLFLIDSFGKRLSSHTLSALHSTLSFPCTSKAGELLHMLEKRGGEGALDDIPRPVNLGAALHLLIRTRNLVVARGPMTQQADTAFFQTLFAVALEFLRALPWETAVLRVQEGDRTCEYRGTVPTLATGDPQHPIAIRMPADTTLTARSVDASLYFLPLARFSSVAMFAGEDTMYDPVSGIHLSSVSQLRRPSATHR